MSKIQIQGGVPLNGTVKISGAKNSALKLLHACMFSNEDVILNNVPKIRNIEVDMEILRSIGGTAEWIGNGRVRLNGSTINSYEVPYELGSKYRTASLLAAPLVYRFGRARIPLPGGCRIGYRPINRWIDTWKALGMNVTEDKKFVNIEAENPVGTDIFFKINTHSGTDNALLSAVFSEGETTIYNAAEEPEVDDLIQLFNAMGGHIERADPKMIKVIGAKHFHGAEFTVQPDRSEVVTFAVAAVMTNGSVNITGVDKTSLLAFTNVLTKIGVRFELQGTEMRVWNQNNSLEPVHVTTAPAPGFMTDWQPLITLLLTQANGTSYVHDTVYTDRFVYTKDLNNMGASIEMKKPSEMNIEAVISDDSYNIEEKGEPFTIAQINGPTPLTAHDAKIPDLRAGATLVIAALAAEGVSELDGYEHVVRGYENFAEKLTRLGAQLVLVDDGAS